MRWRSIIYELFRRKSLCLGLFIVWVGRFGTNSLVLFFS